MRKYINLFIWVIYLLNNYYKFSDRKSLGLRNYAPTESFELIIKKNKSKKCGHSLPKFFHYCQKNYYKHFTINNCS
jgi:hypothetical protein